MIYTLKTQMLSMFIIKSVFHQPSGQSSQYEYTYKLCVNIFDSEKFEMIRKITDQCYSPNFDSFDRN